MVVIFVWVNDIIFVVSNIVLMIRLNKKRFYIKDLGRFLYFLGIDFEQSDSFVNIKVFNNFEMCNCKLRVIFFDQKFVFGSEIFYDFRRYGEVCWQFGLCYGMYQIRQKLSGKQVIIVCVVYFRNIGLQ